MYRLISTSDDEGQIGEVFSADIFNPWEKKYQFVMIRILRIATENEYIEFCNSHELPIRNTMKKCPYYYEIEILD